MDSAFEIVTYATGAIVAYYVVLFAASLWTTRRTPRSPRLPLTFVLVVPAHNEELVIAETVRSIRALESERVLTLIVDDGSTDRTRAVVQEAAAGDPRIMIVERSPEVSGQGKGEVLNHAYGLVSRLVRERDPRLGGATADHVVLGVLDADGRLESHALTAVAPYYADPRVAGVQLPVCMWNGREGFLSLMQDLEFTGFCLFVQAGRDPFGSVGLGGNGQFIRLSALEELGERPWTKCLTEDLDVGLSLVEAGWRNRFCPRARVSQQAVRRFRPFFRQRTRWIQGHYSCWRHLAPIWRRRGIPLRTRIDLTMYLLLVAFVLMLAAQFAIGLVSVSGLLTVEANPLGFIQDESLYRAATLALSCAPLLAFAVTYQRFAVMALPWWSTVGLFFTFAFYGFFWGVPASLRAIGRIVIRRDSWTKTPRTASCAAPAPPAPASQLAPDRPWARRAPLRIPGSPPHPVAPRPRPRIAVPNTELLTRVAAAEARARRAQQLADEAEARLAMVAGALGRRAAAIRGAAR